MSLSLSSKRTNTSSTCLPGTETLAGSRHQHQLAIRISLFPPQPALFCSLREDPGHAAWVLKQTQEAVTLHSPSTRRSPEKKELCQHLMSSKGRPRAGICPVSVLLSEKKKKLEAVGKQLGQGVSHENRAENFKNQEIRKEQQQKS